MIPERTPQERLDFLSVHPEYSERRDRFGQLRPPTDHEIDTWMDLEETAELEMLELDYELLGAIIDGFFLRHPNLGEDNRLAFAAWLRFAFVTGKYYGLREGWEECVRDRKERMRP